jgi:hypothetical protein
VEVASFNDVIEGLKILAKYEEKGLEAQIAGAGYDFLGGSDAEVTDDADVRRLEELGWHWDDESDCWGRFV